MPTFEEYRDNHLAAPRTHQRDLREGQDWMPILTFESPTGFYRVPLLTFTEDPALWDHVAAEYLPRLLVNRRATRYALVLPQGDYLAVEVGQLHRAEVWEAVITRPTGRGPELGDWTRTYAGPGIGTLHAALEIVASQ